MTEILLPEPKFRGASSFEARLRERRSVREFSPASVSLVSMGQLLWAAQGLTSPTGERTAPSAGALYPLELYLVAGRVDSVTPGTYRYEPRGHALRLHFLGVTVSVTVASQRWGLYVYVRPAGCDLFSVDA